MLQPNKYCDINESDDAGRTAIMWASQLGHEKVVQALLDKGADVNAQGGYYGNALQEASYGGHEKVVQMLLEKCVDVNAQGGYFGNALQAASHGGHEKVVQMLLDAGADVNAQGGRFGTALHAATAAGHEAIAEFLLNSSASPNVIDSFGRTPLHLALYRGDETIVSALVQHGADPSLVDGYGRCAMDWANLDETLSQKVAGCAQGSIEISYEIQVNKLKQSIYTLSRSLLEADQKTVSPGLHELGHCLMFLQNYGDARIAFQHQIVQVDKGDPIHHATCNTCGSNESIKGLKFVCQTCPDQDRCEPCMQGYANDLKMRCCRGHTFLQIPGPGWNAAEVGEGLEQGTKEWLKALMERYTPF
ncbi:hypothetical protein H2198_006274 [Neophaeococcomyces mojaviensis]|uniref:Uncharacterized protein n=1 Tax=Neophaeococcomyces mojaviensis TaxID=3383035 RepID=A0ACC3A3E4_9EURO|nr:hypothetical protein H2198_006274 [Knufia sp. JES_112]